jgi:uncharacterized protein YjiK
MNIRITSIMMISSYFISIIFLNILSCANSVDKGDNSADISVNSINSIGYDLNNPDVTIILPPVLHEISGITIIDSSTVACIQDENGIVFIYDLQRKEIKKHITFYGNGDYEEITFADGEIYILRSDAVLFKIKYPESSDDVKEIRLKDIPHNEIEGLCYDRYNNRLLIAPKDKADKDSEVEVKRGIYEFDLNRKELINKPVMSFKLSSIKKFASKDYNFNEEKGKKKNKKDKPDIKFKPSAIGIHPLNGDLFVLSAEDQMLFIFNMKGDIKNVIRLDPYLFNMPEGIAFFENGDMLISNEGQNMRPTLLRFNYE